MTAAVPTSLHAAGSPDSSATALATAGSPDAAVAAPSVVTESLTLSDAVKMGLSTNPSIRAAEQQVRAAEAKAGQSKAQGRLQISLNSTVTASDGDVWQGPPSHEDFGTIQNTLTIPLPNGLKTSFGMRQAASQLAAAQAQYAAARRGLISQIVSAYFDLLRKQDLLQNTKESEAEAVRQLDEITKRNAAGDASDLDVLRAQAPVAAAKASAQQAAAAVQQAIQALNSLIGRSLDETGKLALPTVIAGLRISTLDDARAKAEKAAPEIAAAEANAAAMEAALNTARLWRRPDLSLNVSDTRSGDKTGFSRVDAVGASITLPLNDGGLGREQVREAEANLAQAVAQTETARQAVRLAASFAFLTAQSTANQLEAAQSARAVAQTIYDKTVLGYQKGLFSLSDVLTAQAALVQARRLATQAVYDAAVAAELLNIALGQEAV